MRIVTTFFFDTFRAVLADTVVEGFINPILGIDQENDSESESSESSERRMINRILRLAFQKIIF